MEGFTWESFWTFWLPALCWCWCLMFFVNSTYSKLTTFEKQKNIFEWFLFYIFCFIIFIAFGTILIYGFLLPGIQASAAELSVLYLPQVLGPEWVYTIPPPLQ